MTRHSCYQSVRRLSVSALCIAVLLLSSCTSRIGYGVVQWSVPEYGLAAGDVVPVFIKSNIGKVYVVGSGPDIKPVLNFPCGSFRCTRTGVPPSKLPKLTANTAIRMRR